MKKYLIFLLLAPLLLAFTCDEDADINYDKLNELGILGEWEINSETINGISDLTVQCCKFIEFLPDSNNEDFNGLFTFNDDPSQSYNGVFTVDPTNQVITFQRDGNEDVVYSYTINGSQDTLSFTFTENDAIFEQNWVKIN
ncbi:lipocalin family protein [Paucihalobacter sp.]|uniref:lipocalin family protein n=1 Tax=Paucihalobacter sp. TaxID=2850405 RepID=UPI003D161F54